MASRSLWRRRATGTATTEPRPAFAEHSRWPAARGATSLELRAALSLSRLASSPDAHQLLSEVAGRFTEGYGTADLCAAPTELSVIHPPSDD